MAGRARGRCNNMNLVADDPESSAHLAAFLDGLQQLGWTDGRNVRDQAGAHRVDDLREHDTLLLVTASNAFNATLYDKLNFNFIRDIAPVAGIMRVPSVMLVHPSVPAKTIPELIAYAKANPRKINVASGSIGGPGHVAAELF